MLFEGGAFTERLGSQGQGSSVSFQLFPSKAVGSVLRDLGFQGLRLDFIGFRAQGFSNQRFASLCVER